MNGGNSDEAEALIQVFIRRASFEQGEGDEVQFSLQHHHQLSVSANRPTGVHQALSDKRITIKNTLISNDCIFSSLCHTTTSTSRQ